MSYSRQFPAARLRRVRAQDFSRRLVREHQLTANDFIYPVFVMEGQKREEPIGSMPGIKRQTLDLLLQTAERCLQLGIPAIAIFPVIAADKKTLLAEEAFNEDGLVPRTVRAIKQRF